MENAAMIGHNNPPSIQEEIQAFLMERSADLRHRHTELIEAAARAPSVCNDDETAGKIADMVKLLSSCGKAFESQRIDAKEPYLTGQRAVDGFYKKFTESLATQSVSILKTLNLYLRRKEDEKRADAAAAAAAQRAEAERLAAEAAALERANMAPAAEETLNAAVRASEETKKLEKVADSRPADLARTRGDYGSLATLRTSWVGEIKDRNALDLDALRPYFTTDTLQKAINAFVKAGGRELRGAVIEEQSSAMVR